MAFTPIDHGILTYDDFVESYKSGSLRLAVNTNAAGYLFTTTLKEYAGQQSLLRALAFGGFLGGFLAIYFIGWWSTALFAISILSVKSSRSHTDKAAIKAALNSEEAYRILTRERVIVISN